MRATREKEGKDWTWRTALEKRGGESTTRLSFLEKKKKEVGSLPATVCLLLTLTYDGRRKRGGGMRKTYQVAGKKKEGSRAGETFPGRKGGEHCLYLPRKN